MQGLSIQPLILGCLPSSLCTHSPRATHPLLRLPPACGPSPSRPAPRVHVEGTGLCSLHLGPGLAASNSGHCSLGSASCCPGGSHLCPCLWGAALSPGRARGCCISATPLGSPSSWPLSLRLGSRGQGSGGWACPEPQPPTPSGNPLLLKSQRQLRCTSGVPGWSTHPQPAAPSTERGMEASFEPASAGRRLHRCLPRATVPISQLVLGAGQGTTEAEPACPQHLPGSQHCGLVSWRHLLGSQGATSSHPAPSLPVTKVETPFTKAFDWQAAYSPSPWEGEGVEGSVPCPSCPSLGRTPAPGEGTTHREALGAQPHPACPPAHPGRRPPLPPQEGPTPLSLFASLMRVLPPRPPPRSGQLLRSGPASRPAFSPGACWPRRRPPGTGPSSPWLARRRGAGGLTYTRPAEGGAGWEGAGRWAGSVQGGAEGRGRKEGGPAGEGRGLLRPGRGAGPAQRGWACARFGRWAPRADAGSGARSSPRAWLGSPVLSPSS